MISNIIAISLFSILLIGAIIAEIKDYKYRLANKVILEGRIESLVENTIYWRRSYIISCIIFLLCLASNVIKYSITNLIFFIILSTFVIYFQFNFFNYHQEGFIYKLFKCNLDTSKLNIYRQIR